MNESQKRNQLGKGENQELIWNKIYIEFTEDDIHTDEDIHAVVVYQNAMIKAYNAKCKNGKYLDEVVEEEFKAGFKKRNKAKEKKIKDKKFKEKNGCARCLLYAPPRECFEENRCTLTEEDKVRYGVKKKVRYCYIDNRTNCVYPNKEGICLIPCTQRMIREKR